MAPASEYVVLYDETAWSVLADCDCACPSTVATLAPLPDTSLPLRCHPHLRWLRLDEAYSVAFVPSFSCVAVLNAAARSLVESFAAPRPLQAETDDAAATLRLCYQLGLLTSGDGTIPAPPPADTLVAWVHVTNACNLRCTYCYVDKTDEAMSTETGMAAINAVLRSARLHGYRNVLLKYAGGEAALNMPLVVELHQYAQSRAAAMGMSLRGGVLSNGTALTRHKLAQMRALGLDLMISLDGLAADHDAQRPLINGRGSYQAVIAGIERALAAGLTPQISITVTGRSVAGLPGLLAWLLDRDLPFAINFYRQTDGSASFDELQLDEQQIIDGLRAAYAVIAQRPPQRSLLGALLDRTNLSAPHGRTCAVGENYLVIDHQGRIAKCQMELKRPVTSVGAHDPLMLIRADTAGVQNLPVDEKEGCRSCEWRYWCSGGCPIETFRATGRYDLRSPNCRIYKALYPDVLRLEGQRLLYHQAEPAT
jgi:uncharacterized protein